MIDNFTKYLELFPIKEGTAAGLVDKLAHEYIPRHGAPEQLHSDQGKNLNATVVIDVCVTFFKYAKQEPDHFSRSQTERLSELFERLMACCAKW